MENKFFNKGTYMDIVKKYPQLDQLRVLHKIWFRTPEGDILMRGHNCGHDYNVSNKDIEIVAVAISDTRDAGYNDSYRTRFAQWTVFVKPGLTEEERKITYTTSFKERDFCISLDVSVGKSDAEIPQYLLDLGLTEVLNAGLKEVRDSLD